MIHVMHEPLRRAAASHQDYSRRSLSDQGVAAGDAAGLRRSNDGRGARSAFESNLPSKPRELFDEQRTDQTPLLEPAYRRPALIPFFLLLLLASTTASAEAFEPERITGVWIRSQRSEDDARRRAAIEEITQPMSFFIRGLARTVMKRSIRPAERYVIRAADIGLSIRAEDEAPETALLNGELDSDPDATVRSRPLADGFVQTWQARREESRDEDVNRGTTTWRLDANDELLRVTVTVHDERFPHPLRYTTTYRRSDDPGTD